MPSRPQVRTAVIGLGASLGDRRRALRLAVAALAATRGVEVLRVSRPVVSRGIGPGVGPFLNAAVRIRTELGALELLERCKHIERRLGRKPSRRWGERAVDCDILFIEGRVVRHPRLTVPHPRFEERRFAVGPSQEVASDLRWSETGTRLRDLPLPSLPRTWWGPGLGGHRCGGRVLRRAEPAAALSGRSGGHHEAVSRHREH